MKSTALFALILFAASSFAATPAEIAIKQAAANIEKQPTHYPYYNDLAMAYARRARETADAQFYANADEALRKSFALAPDNFEGRKVSTFLQLERHEYTRALEGATILNKRMPDDLAVYGYLVEANVELGNDKEAIAAAQWMLDLRPGNSGGLIHAAYLRELHGNLSGALELMQMAFEATPPSESSDRTWMLTQMSHLQLLTGDLASAERSADSALQIFPTSHYALAGLAHVRLAQQRYDDAVSLMRERYEIAPHTENLYALGEAQELAGQHEEAQASFAKFETLARAEIDRADNSNHELVAYYVDHAHAHRKRSTSRVANWRDATISSRSIRTPGHWLPPAIARRRTGSCNPYSHSAPRTPPCCITPEPSRCACMRPARLKHT